MDYLYNKLKIIFTTSAELKLNENYFYWDKKIWDKFDKVKIKTDTVNIDELLFSYKEINKDRGEKYYKL